MKPMTKEAQAEIKNITRKIVREYKPEKIILFGSFAYGKPKASSDIDMLIVKKTKKRRIDRIKEILYMIDNNFPFEPIVYTPREIDNRLTLGDFFLQTIMQKGKVLYEKR
jgi:uncharacterized protein